MRLPVSWWRVRLDAGLDLTLLVRRTCNEDSYFYFRKRMLLLLLLLHPGGGAEATLACTPTTLPPGRGGGSKEEVSRQQPVIWPDGTHRGAWSWILHSATRAQVVSLYFLFLKGEFVGAC